VRRIAEAALDRKAREVLALDVRGLTSVTDVFLIASGDSDRQVRAIADSVLEAARAAGDAALGMEGYDEGRWVLIDLNDIIVHVFQGEVRRHYDLERLWCDARSTAFEAAAAPGSAGRRSAP
jgi:ribosome-associated protein